MWVEIFKTGRHTDSSGNPSEWESDDLDTAVSLYNSKIDEDESFTAPVVKGHPESDLPACGWVEKLARRGSILIAKLKQLDPEFVEDVNSGRYKRISAAFYPEKMLRHVGFLGAAVPAVRGLKAPNFRAGVLFSEFVSDAVPSDDDPIDSDSLADIPPENYTSDEEDAAGSNSDAPVSWDGISTDSTAETMPDESGSAYDELLSLNQFLTEENQRLTDEIAEIRRRATDKIKEERTRKFREFADSVIANKRGISINPGDSESLVELLQSANEQSPADEYSENNLPLSERIMQFIVELKPGLNFSEFAVRSKRPGSVPVGDYAQSNISQGRMAIHEKAKEIQCEMPELSYENAVELAVKMRSGAY